MQVSGLRMNQNRFDACPALAVLLVSIAMKTQAKVETENWQ